jgi:hypothetical protein
MNKVKVLKHLVLPLVIGSLLCLSNNTFVYIVGLACFGYAGYKLVDILDNL